MQLLDAEPEPLHHAGAVVLDEHVARAGQADRELHAPRRRQVDADVALAGVLLHEVRRQPVDAGAGVAREVTVGRLELDHVGAEVGQHPRAVRPGEDAREVEDADAGQRASHTQTVRHARTALRFRARNGRSAGSVNSSSAVTPDRCRADVPMSRSPSLTNRQEVSRNVSHAFGALGVPDDLIARLARAPGSPNRSRSRPPSSPTPSPGATSPAAPRPAPARRSPSASRSSPASRRRQRRRPTALVLAPTRELAEQIATELRPLARTAPPRGRRRSTAASATARSARRSTAAPRSSSPAPAASRTSSTMRALTLQRRRPGRHRRGRPDGRHGLPARRPPDPRADAATSARCCCSRPRSTATVGSWPRPCSASPVRHEVGPAGPT